MFFKFPYALEFDSKYQKLSSDAKILYIHLLRLNDLSQKNGWYDEERKVYIHCTRKKMSEILHCSESTAYRVLKQLRDFGLVRLGRCVNGASPRLYVYNIANNAPPKKGGESAQDAQSANNSNIDDWELEILKSMQHPNDVKNRE